MAISSINNDELLKKLLEQRQIGMPQTQVNPPQKPEGAEGVGSANSFDEKYGSGYIGGLLGRGEVETPVVQDIGSRGASNYNPVNANNNSTSQNFSLPDSVRMDNLPPAPTVTAVQTPVVPSALTAPGGNEASGKQGGATSQDNGAKRFGASDIFALTGGLNSSGTVTVSDSSNSPSEPRATGEATIEPEPPKDNGVNTPTAEGTPQPSGENSTVNPNDSANGQPDNGDSGAGEGGADGSGKSADQVAQEEADRQAQILLQQQQEKVLEEQRKNAA